MENNKETAPAATDTGLETFSMELTPSGHPYMKSDPDGDYVTRSQAVELLAAKDETIALAETTMIEMHQDLNKLEADNSALIHDLNRIKDHETELVNDNAELTRDRDSWRRVAEKLAGEKQALEAKLAAAEKQAELAEMSSSALLVKLKRTQHISRNRLLRLRNLRHKIIFALKDVENCFNRNCYETARIKIRELIRWEIKF